MGNLITPPCSQNSLLRQIPLRTKYTSKRLRFAGSYLFLCAIGNEWHHICSRRWICCHCILKPGHLFLQISAVSITNSFDLYLSVCEMPWNSRWMSNYLMQSLVFDAIHNIKKKKKIRRGKCAFRCLLGLKFIVFVSSSV